MLEPVQRLVHGGAGPSHPLWQRVLQQDQANAEQNLQAKTILTKYSAEQREDTKPQVKYGVMDLLCTVVPGGYKEMSSIFADQ